MHEKHSDDANDTHTVFDASVVRAFHDRLAAPLDDTDPLGELRALEELKNAVAVRQARLAVAVHETQRAADVPRDISVAATAREAGTRVALARRCAPHLGSRLLGLAHAVVEEMPHIREALAAGVISEWDATALCRETACLTRPDRAAVDAAIADQLGTVSHQRLETSAREHAYRLDPEAVTARRARAERQRRVSLRPVPDCMTRLSALLPVKDGVACYAALSAVADATATAEHPRGQLMADTLVARVTGHPSATAAGGTDDNAADSATDDGGVSTADTQGVRAGMSAGGVGVNVNLVMPFDTLTGDTPAHLAGYGPIPADLAREWIRCADADQKLQVRRLFSFPGTGDLVGMNSRARTYSGLLAMFIRLRDQTCRTPFCNAPIRHIDHIVSHAAGGPTSERNAEGLCERCNYDKEHADHDVTGDASQTTTRTGSLTAASRPPAPPGMPPPTASYVERTLIDITWNHHTGRPPAPGDSS